MEEKLKEERNFNRNHPELRVERGGEIFIGNIREGDTIFIREKIVTEGRDAGKTYKIYRHNNTGRWDDFKKIPFKTRRLGRIAYDSSGRRVQGQRPVFVQLWEYRKNGYNSIYPYNEYFLLKN